MFAHDGPTLGRFFGDLPARSHGALAAPDDRTRFRLVGRYLRAGLAQGWYCVFVSRPGGLARARSRLGKAGLRPKDHPGTLSIRDGSRFLLPGRAVDWDRWNGALEAVFRDARRRGAPGVRFVNELAGALLAEHRYAAWYQLEITLHDLSPECSVLCAYDDPGLGRFRGGRLTVERERLPARARRVVDLHTFTVLSETEDESILLEPEAAPVIVPVDELSPTTRPTARISE